MTSSTVSTGGALASRGRRAGSRWHRRRTPLLLGAALLQSACSLLIQIDDDEDEASAHVDASTAHEPNQPREPRPDGGGGASVSELDAGVDADVDAEVDAGRVAPAPPAPPAVALAFIEHPEEGEATLRLVDARAALRPDAEARADEWRRTLRPRAQAGDVLDFAWSPDGQRIAVRHETLEGPRVALFAAPDWRELTLVRSSPATQSRTTAAARYRWSPDGAALALELAGEQGPAIAGFVIGGDGARELPPVAFSGPVEALGWLSPSALFVVQPEADEPEFLQLELSAGAFASPITRSVIAAFFPIELRRTHDGLLGASSDPTNFLFFWPETPAAGVESSFSPGAYLSSREGFAAEPEEAEQLSRVFHIGDNGSTLDTLPACPVVLAWAEGPSQRSLAGSRLVCLNVADGSVALTLYAYDAAGARRSLVLEDATLRADHADVASWETGARGFAVDGSWLAMSTVQHDALIDLRGASPRYEIRPAAAGSSALGFSPSGRYLLAQRGRQVELTVLAPAAASAPVHVPVARAGSELAPCDTALHASSFCGAPSAARAAAARWARTADVASLLTDGAGLVVLSPTEDSVGFASMPVSTCGSGCVSQYEFAE